MLGDRELQRPIELLEPPAEGDWLITAVVVGDD